MARRKRPPCSAMDTELKDLRHPAHHPPRTRGESRREVLCCAKIAFARHARTCSGHPIGRCDDLSAEFCLKSPTIGWPGLRPPKRRIARRSQGCGPRRRDKPGHDGANEAVAERRRLVRGSERGQQIFDGPALAVVGVDEARLTSPSVPTTKVAGIGSNQVLLPCDGATSQPARVSAPASRPQPRRRD